MEGRRVAVLVGCNYKGTLAELRGCVNDVWGMHAALVDRFHFRPDDIQVLVDNDPKFTLPTGANIRRALQMAIASTSGPGDVLFFHFSGHGTQLPIHKATCTPLATTLDYDECIVPCDMNLLTDEDIREVVDSLPQGVTFTIIADSCHSGGLIRYEKEQIGDSFTNKVITPGLESYSRSNGFKDIQVMEHNMKKKSNITFKMNRSLPSSTLVEILKKQTGKMDMGVVNLENLLVAIFKEEVSIKFRKSIIFSSLRQNRNNMSLTHGENTSMHFSKTTHKTTSFDLPSPHYSCSKSLAKNYDKCQEHNEVLGDTSKGDQAILISACQAYESANDAAPSNTNGTLAFGAMSHTILDVLSKLEKNAFITNYDLVMNVRKLLTLQGIFHQHPGLYCSDNLVNAKFILG